MTNTTINIDDIIEKHIEYINRKQNGEYVFQNYIDLYEFMNDNTEGIETPLDAIDNINMDGLDYNLGFEDGYLSALRMIQRLTD